MNGTRSDVIGLDRDTLRIEYDMHPILWASKKLPVRSSSFNKIQKLAEIVSTPTQTPRIILNPESKITNTPTDRDRCTSLLAILDDHPTRYSVHLFTVLFWEVHNPNQSRGDYPTKCAISPNRRSSPGSGSAVTP